MGLGTLKGDWTLGATKQGTQPPAQQQLTLRLCKVRPSDYVLERENRPSAKIFTFTFTCSRVMLASCKSILTEADFSLLLPRRSTRLEGRESTECSGDMCDVSCNMMYDVGGAAAVNASYAIDATNQRNQPA